jgi:corrinoid protein of di/trimethylamine methyltransferase
MGIGSGYDVSAVVAARTRLTASVRWRLAHLATKEDSVSEDLYAQMKQAIIDGEVEGAEELAKKGLEVALSPADILDKGFVKGIEEVGDLFGKGEFFLPELVQGAEAMKAAVAILQPELDKMKEGRKTMGVAVAGTVAGDIHEIGKTIVCSMLSAAGFTVTDVGCDVPVETFVAKVNELKPDLLLLSALLTTTMPNQQKTIEALKAAGLRDSLKVMIGGAPTTRAWADEIGADGYAEDAIEAVARAKQVLGVG